MPNNELVTGPPGSGKTTVIDRVREQLEREGYAAGGIYCPELREDGERVGFEIIDVMTGASRELAHVDRIAGPRVGKYCVSVENIDRICSTAFPAAFARADLLVVDEIAPMETYSGEFTQFVEEALAMALPVVAAIHYQSTTGFIGRVKERDDVRLYEVTEESREELPSVLAERILSAL